MIPDENRIEMPDELTPEDEAILDAIWDNVDPSLTNPIVMRMRMEEEEDDDDEEDDDAKEGES